MELFQPLVCIVDFHHVTGPIIERWFGLKDELLLIAEKEWSLLPFLALPDGSHAYEEEFSYFTLRYPQNAATTTSTGPGGVREATSLFGIACTSHLKAEDLLYKDADVSRTSVQKAVVVVVDTPYLFSQIKDKLSAVTKTWFAQRDFRDVTIIEQLHDSLFQAHEEPTSEEYFGMSLRELIHDYRQQTMVLFKCMLLQPKMLFYSSKCERLCLLQFALISLMPNLLRNLQDSADVDLDSYEKTHVMPSTLRTSDRNSLLAFMGLPLQIFGKGSFFSPYTPLQQLDVLSSSTTTSYLAGTTNSLVLLDSSRYCDVFVNLDEEAVDILNPTLLVSLSVSDRRFIDFLVDSVAQNWDPRDPSRPSDHGFTGSEDFIRLQFESWLLGLMACAKYRKFVESGNNDGKVSAEAAQSDPISDYGAEWVSQWIKTDNYRIFDMLTDSYLFDIVEPRHPTAGALSIDDVQRRVAQQVADLHLDERLNTGRETIGRHLATGQQKVSTAFNTLWADVEERRKKYAERQTSESKDPPADAGASNFASRLPKAPDLTQAQANVQAASAKAGAYLSSWNAWAAEKRRTGFNRSSSPANGSI